MKKMEVLKFLAEELSTPKTHLCLKNIADQTIGKPEDFSRAALIAAVRELQEKTGKTLLANSATPMKYLGENVTLGDIAEFFSIRGSERISAIRAKIFRAPEKSKEDVIEEFRLKAACVYARILDKPVDDDLPYRKVQECLPEAEDFSWQKDDWDLPVFWMEDELGVSFPHPFSWFTPKTTVAELIDAFCEGYAKKLEA